MSLGGHHRKVLCMTMHANASLAARAFKAQVHKRPVNYEVRKHALQQIEIWAASL